MVGRLDAFCMTKLSAACRADTCAASCWLPVQKYLSLVFATASQMAIILLFSQRRGPSIGGVSMLQSVAPASTKTSCSVLSLINVSAHNTISHVPSTTYEAVACVIEKYTPDECLIIFFASKNLGSKLFACIAKYLEATLWLSQNWIKRK